MNPIKQLLEHGQSVWLDYIRRDFLRNGDLERRVQEGLRGITSNPSIFEKALSEGQDYNDAVVFLIESNPEADTKSLYEALAVEDIQCACDILRPIYDQSSRVDGMASIEVSPHLARDTQGTIAEARRLWKAVNRPNCMIKIPATPEGVPAIEECTAAGININVTLLFSVEQYEAAAQAYIRGCQRAEQPSHVTSVASFFVSRVDTAVDEMLVKTGRPESQRLIGQTAVANCKIAYNRFREIFDGDDFARLRRRGCRVQRLLWGSTSTKNPAYSDVKYVEELVGPDTVNTMPPATYEAFLDHGSVRGSVAEGVDRAERQLQQLAELGIDLNAVTRQLQADGVNAFAESFDKLLKALDQKKQIVRSGQVYR